MGRTRYPPHCLRFRDFTGHFVITVQLCIIVTKQHNKCLKVIFYINRHTTTTKLMIQYRGLFWRVNNFRIWVENVYEKYWVFLADTTVVQKFFAVFTQKWYRILCFKTVYPIHNFNLSTKELLRPRYFRKFIFLKVLQGVTSSRFWESITDYIRIIFYVQFTLRVFDDDKSTGVIKSLSFLSVSSKNDNLGFQ